MPKRILIIDDEQELVAGLVARFEAFGNALVASACDPEFGVKKARSWQPDAVLMDIYMPKLDGWAATRLLREDPKTKDIPVVIMTSVLSKALLKQVEVVGAQRVITKPFEERDIHSLLAWLESRESAPRAVPPA